LATFIHPTAHVDPGAELGTDVVIGPFCHVGAGVEVGDGSELLGHVTLLGPTRLGPANVLYPQAVLGTAPQDRSYAREATRLEVGASNVFREQVTVHRGTAKADGVTRIGSHCLFMVGAHIAHDCAVADRVTLTNLTTLGGHVIVQEHVVCGGHAAVAPFVTLGRGSFVAGGARVEQDVPPFIIAAGDRARVRALNRVGLQRMGAGSAAIAALERAFRLIWRSGQPLAAGIPVAERELGSEPLVAELVKFLQARSAA